MSENKFSYKINVICCVVTSLVIEILLIFKEQFVNQYKKAVYADKSLDIAGKGSQIISEPFPDAETVDKYLYLFLLDVKRPYAILFLGIAFLFIVNAIINARQVYKYEKLGVVFDYKYYTRILILFFIPYIIPIIHEMGSRTFMLI